MDNFMDIPASTARIGDEPLFTPGKANAPTQGAIEAFALKM